MAGIRIESVNKAYGALAVVKDFSLEVADGEFVVLVGPSGCGKSTMLKILAGLEPATSGRVFIGEREVTDLAPGDRDIAMVFQNYALYPHLTVRRNMGFGLRMRGMSSVEIDRRVNDAARILGVEHLLDRRPKALSGGQRQRVALGRAIVREPLAFLMDEPLSNLDASLRVRMRAEIGALHQRLGVTTVYVTHDQIEAMTMAHRIVIMRDGVVQQIAPPDEMFRRPANLFVAGFIGSPSMNFLRSRIEAGGETPTVRLFGQTVSVDGRLGEYAGRDVIVGLRPEHIGEDGPVSFVASPRLVESLGSEKYIHIDIPAENRPPGTADDEHGADLVARLMNAGPVEAGGSIRLGFAPGSLHVFDAASGEALNHAEN